MEMNAAGRQFKTAFIPGAGLGTRLRPLTTACPKPLLELGGRPAITYVMDHLLSIGVERFIVNTHHRPEIYLEKFPKRQWRDRKVIFRHEPTLLDTAGGLKNIEDLLEGDETVI
ncbi:MAG: sugar phosphate nucleotidyltransferase, partial [Acidobacteriota bacterium]